MQMKVGVELKGDKDLLNALNSIDHVMRRRIMRQAVTVAIGPVLKDAKANVKSLEIDDEHGDKRQLAKSLGKRAKTYRRGGTTVGIVGPRHGFENPDTGKDPVVFGPMVEHGTKPHVIRSKEKKPLYSVDDENPEFFGWVVQHPGTEPRPWLRPAFDMNKSSMVGHLKQLIWSRIWEQARKEAAKSKGK